MKFSIYKSAEAISKHVIIPFDKENIEELKALKIDGVENDRIINLLKSYTAGNLTIAVGSHILYLIELASKAKYCEIKDAFTKVAIDIKCEEAHVISTHRDYTNLEIKAIINGLSLSDYNINLYKTTGLKVGPSTHFIFHPKQSIEDAMALIESAVRLSEAQKLVMDIVNAPANKLIPSEMATLVEDKLKDTTIRVKIMEQKEIFDEGLHAVLAVNRGSEDPARFVIMEYRSAEPKDNTPHFGLVGKGITFDTGGISLKKSKNLHYMKCDLGGGAAIIGAMYLLAHEKPNADITAIVPITENSIGTKAIKPGDVINSHSGQTIEIIDTDAEGRLILADGLSYMLKNYSTDHLIDMATLTGSIVQTLGYQAGGLFSNNDELVSGLIRSGEQVCERLWRMPLWEDYKADITSEVADIRNFSGRPLAGGISAAKFLEAFIDGHKSWAHLDIAGVAFGKNPYTAEKAGTGYGPHLISQWILNAVDNKSK